MERTKPVTVVPGWGGVLMGAMATAAAVVSYGAEPVLWLKVWVGASILGMAIGLWGMHQKAQAAGMSLQNSVTRKFWLSLIPPLIAGLTLSVALWDAHQIQLLPALWLLSYGAGVTAAGAFSVQPVPLMGGTFMLAGVLAALLPQWGTLWLGAGFGGLHLVFGWLIAKKYGG